MKDAKVILDASNMRSVLAKMGGDIASTCREQPVAFVGIRSRGAPLAERLATIYHELTGFQPLRGTLDITLYRDDFSSNWPEVRASHIPFDAHGTTIVLVDDVLFTGRTIRAALNALMDFGRPRAVRLAVLVDRGLRELPVHADFAGLRLASTSNNHVRVRLEEIDGSDEVILENRVA